MSVLPFAPTAAADHLPEMTDDLPPEPGVCDCITSGNPAKPKQHGADPHAKNCAVYFEPMSLPPEQPSAPIVADLVPSSDPQARAEIEAQALRVVVNPVMVRAAEYVCATPADYARAGDLLAELAKMEAAIDEKLGPIITDAFNVHRRLTTLRAEMKDPITARQKAIKDKAANWRADEDRKAREEANRLALEQQAQERARAEQQARELEAAGQKVDAEQVRQEAEQAPLPAVHVQTAVPDVPGMVARYEYGFTVTNRALIPAEYFVLDEKSLLAVVKRQKDACTIPGIKVTKTPATTFRKGQR